MILKLTDEQIELMACRLFEIDMNPKKSSDFEKEMILICQMMKSREIDIMNQQLK